MKKTKRNFMSFITFVLVLVTMFVLPTQVIAQTIATEPTEDSSPYVETNDEAASEQGSIIGEDKTKRDEYTKYFITNAGTTIIAQYAMPVHYKNADGEYVDFDNSLTSSEATVSYSTQDEATTDEISEYNLRTSQETVRTEEIFVNKKSNAKVSHFKKSGKAKLIEIDKDGHKISWGYSGANIVTAKEKKKSAEELTGNDAYLTLTNLSSKVVYENIYNNIDLEVINSTTGVKENLILKESNAKNVFKLEYNIGDLTAESKDSRTIELKDASGAVVYTISAPYMKDANGKKSEALELKILQNNNGKLSVRLTADKSWLKDKERVFPVTIDPCFEYRSNSTDVACTYIYSKQPDTVRTVEQYFYVGTASDEAGDEKRGLLKINQLPNLGIGDMIIDVKVGLYLNPIGNLFKTSYIGIYGMTEDWTKEKQGTWSDVHGSYSPGLIDYNKVVANQQSGWLLWDITELAKKWYSEPSTNKGFMVKMVDGTRVNQDIRFMSPTYAYDEENLQTARPTFAITYRNNKGLENYWNYTTVSAGSAGVAYINNYSGNLVFQTNITNTHGLNLSANLLYTYNSYMADVKETAFAPYPGKGWKLNYCQTLLPSSEYGLSEESQEIWPYVYTDGDGTEHYFRKVNEEGSAIPKYYDEDGLGYELDLSTTTIFKVTDKNKNEMCFNSSTGRLTSFKDSARNTVAIEYNLNADNPTTIITDANDNEIIINSDAEYNYVRSITDPSGRTTTFTYGTNARLTQIKYPDNNVVQFGYDTNGLLTRATDIDGTYITFSYSANGSRGVKTVQEYAADGTAGQKLTFNRTKYNTTIMRSAGADCDFGNSDDILTTYHFDNLGRTTSVSCKTAGGKDLGAAATTYTSDLNSTASNIKSVNKVKQSYSLGANKENLVVNHNLESTANWNKTAWGANETNTVSYSISTNTGSPLYGKGTLKMKVDSVTGNARGRVYQDVPVAYLEPGATYTLSCYVKTENITPASGMENYGAVICATTFNTDGTLKDNYSDHIRSATTTDINNGYRRISVTFATDDNIQKIRVNLALRSATGTAYFDAVQLEKSDAPSNYNLLENASLERCESSAVPNSWTGSSNLTLSTSYDTVSTGHVDGKVSFRIKGEVDKRKNIYQDVYVPTGSSELDTYILSGWATAHSVPKETNSSCFRLLARVYFTDGTYKNNNIYFNTTLEQGTWQYATSAFTLSDGTNATKTPSFIRVYLSYDMQGNYAYFDNISLTKEAVPSYTYNEDGDMVSVVANAEQDATYEYEDNLLTKYIDPKGGEYTYTYKDGTNLLETATTQKGATYTYTYDEAGNVTSVVGSANGLDSIKSEASYNYTTEGGTTYSVTASDQDGKSSTEVYDSKTGTLQNTTDTKGITTTYTYDAETDLVESVSKGNQSVEYTYDAFGKLIGISHEGTVYSFGYDKFGNRTTTAVGSRVLSTNTYDSNNSNLLSMS
ncbi:MAG: DNRLRE domain-containing protein, partial [Ruminococcus sp.]